MVLKPIKRQKVWQQVEKQIKDLIINNKLKIGDKLPSEKELAEKLKVGRRSVREALHS
ncbi:MAG TPA: FadR family transcriptional regulator, partial [Candidatus Aerophobetes bacterium]|nr:FadR family transcriptional regulator [Candidatus Aerophobetes bacterium]